jgi:aspartate/methionine/tyrosine aminotransferase
VTPSTKLVAVNFPHNPTGATLSAQDYEAMVKVATSTGAWLFSDEMYKFSGGPGVVQEVYRGEGVSLSGQPR